MVNEFPVASPLGLVAEFKVADLLGKSPRGRYEASGVVLRQGVFYLVFDNMPHIGRIASLTLGAEGNALLSQDGRLGYEDIAYDPQSDHFFTLIEASHRGRAFMAKVREYDGELGHVSTQWLEFPLEKGNKGMEGLTCVSFEDELYLLALCEGNWCRSGDMGRKPGGGRIQVFGRRRDGWGHLATIRLSEMLPFQDYSSVALDGQRIAVLSQESAALWVGTLRIPGWEIDEGMIYHFPQDDEGRCNYRHAEGVAWLSADRVVIVSDRVVDSANRRFRAKDESIHVFGFPESRARVAAAP